MSKDTKLLPPAEAWVDLIEVGWYASSVPLGEGGGGQAFLAVKTELLDAIGKLSNSIAPDITPDRTADNLRYLAQALHPASQEFGVFKSSKHAGPRMRREIDSLVKCKHKNLVQIFTADPRNNPSWFIMEYFPKGDLAKNALQYKGDALEVLKRAREIAEALCVVHDNKLIHRDIKPENIFLANDGRWVLGDFGIAFESGGARHTEQGVPMTKDWRPDWVVSRRPEDYPPTVDLFLLAKVIYALIAGPGINPPASQLGEPEFHLASMFPEQIYMTSVQIFLGSHITTRERDMGSKTAREFILKLDSLISEISDTAFPSQIFSLIETDPATSIGENSLWRLRNIPVMLPNGLPTLHCVVRVLNAADTKPPEFSISLKNMSGEVVTTTSSDSFSVTASKNPLGTWHTFEMDLKKPIPYQWYILDVDKLQGLAVTGLIIYATISANASPPPARRASS